MVQRPPRSTRPDTRFPYTTRFRSKIQPEQFPKVFGPNADQPLDAAVVQQKFTVLAEEIAAATGKPLQSPEERSEEHTSELQSLMRISYAVFCLKKKTPNISEHHHHNTHCNDVTIINSYNTNL